ncbi:Hydroxymethylglutaryl-CoA lyase [Frigoribacterium sp. JB110]|nr:Hydroxymethylglutaryl-CoA lyase [Frigoribacterium sp. JB110]
MGPALLFCPGDRPDRFAKAADRADAVILDLEDAVALDAKSAAREAVAESRLDPARTIVRLNAAGTEHLTADLDALARSSYRTVMLAKTESRDEIDLLGDLDIIALCETAKGVVNAQQIAAHDRVVALMWGAEDLIASMGGTSSRDESGAYRAVAIHARSRVLLAAAAADKAAIDAICTDIADLVGCHAEADDAAASGFWAKAAIHPAHSAPIRAAFAPSDDLLDWARRVLREAEGRGGVFPFEGRMVDEPVLTHARSILARTGNGAISPDQ